jgi:hypothetical protein
VRGTDTCVIAGQHFYIRGRIVIPVIGHQDPFIWGSWAAVSKKDFERFGQLWDTKVREHEPPLSGLFDNDIPIYPPTRGLKCSLHMKDARKRPSFVLESADHPLVAEQRDGITLDRVKEIAAAVLQHRK